MYCQKRAALTLSAKYKIIQEIQNGKLPSTVCKERNLAKSTVSTIIRRDHEKIIDSYEAQVISSERKRCRLSSHPELDDALLKWFSQARTDNIQISGQQLLAKANKFGYDMKERNVNGYQNFDGVSVGYIDRWKSRNSICEKRLAGESAAVDEDNDAMVNWMENVLPQLLRQYKPENIYNADETWLFWRLTPQKSLVFKNEKCFGGKKAKERITVLCAANMAGKYMYMLNMYMLNILFETVHFKNLFS